MAPKKRLGEMLIEAGIIDETQLKAALGHQRQWGVRIGQALVDLKLATEADIVRALAAKFAFAIARLDTADPQALRQAAKLLPRDFAVRNNVLPIAADTSSITVAMSDPSNLAIVDEVQFRTGKRVKVCIGGDREIAEAVNRQYPGEAQVEAIALDLDAEDVGGEAVFDPFGGGSKDALEAFFGGGPEPQPQEPASPAARPPAAAPGPGRHVLPHPFSAAPARLALPAQPAPRPAPAVQPRPAAAPPSSAPISAAPAPPPSPPAQAPPKPAPAAEPAHAGAAQAPVPAPRAPAPPQRPAAPAGGARDLALDLDDDTARRSAEASPAPSASAPSRSSPPPEPPHVPEPTPPGEPILATELASEEQVEGRVFSRELTDKEIAILDALGRLAAGAHAEPEIVKPAQAMAAVIRLLLRKRIISEPEFLDELTKK